MWAAKRWFNKNKKRKAASAQGTIFVNSQALEGPEINHSSLTPFSWNIIISIHWNSISLTQWRKTKTSSHYFEQVINIHVCIQSNHSSTRTIPKKVSTRSWEHSHTRILMSVSAVCSCSALWPVSASILRHVCVRILISTHYQSMSKPIMQWTLSFAFLQRVVVIYMLEWEWMV